MLNLNADANEYIYISKPFLVVMPSGRKILVRAYEKYAIGYSDANEDMQELIDYYEEVVNISPSQEIAAKVFKDRIKNPRTTQVAWGYNDIDMYPKNGVIRKRPDMNFTKEGIYGSNN